MGALRQRLDDLLLVYPSKSAESYIAFLWSTSSHWALCCFNWDLTLGYQATSLQEGVHSSMKSRLKNQKIAVHEVVQFFRDVMLKRKFNMECNSDRVTIRRLYQEADDRGLKTFSEKVHIYLTEEAQQITLEVLSSGFNYTVEQIDIKDILECYEHTKHRNTSAERFKLIIDNTLSDKYDVNFFKVTARAAGGSIDLVAVFKNGSFACTDPYFANHGLPSPQIMSVFIAGYTSLNVIFHFHPLYLQPFSREISHMNAKDLSVSIYQSKLVCTVVTEEASWNYALQITENEWKVIGLGGQKYNSIINPPIKSIRNHSDSIAEMCKKELQKLLPIIVYEERFRTLVFSVIENIKNIQASEAQNNAQARQKSLGYDDTSVCNNMNSNSTCSISMPLNLVVANNIFDRGTKRKNSGPKNVKTSKTKGH